MWSRLVVGRPAEAAVLAPHFANNRMLTAIIDSPNDQAITDVIGGHR
jgi:hypothetical protein